jgi:hypothetical protein
MARGDCQRAFAQAAADDGISLIRQSLPWLNQRGHLGLPPEGARALPALEGIFTALDGDHLAILGAPLTPLPGDFLHALSGTLVEIDESQHFTSARLATLKLYPGDVELGYDLDRYKRLCATWRAKSDGYFRSKSARAFGAGGRQRQRAYFDALRDIAAPAMGYPPVIRVPAPDRDGLAAYREARDRLRALAAG